VAVEAYNAAWMQFYAYLKTRERLELNLNESVHVTPINFSRPIFDPTAGVAGSRFHPEHIRMASAASASTHRQIY
jgi:hypothetical protein